MEKFLPVFRSSPLFTGISEEEIPAMLGCLDAKITDYPKDCYILRAGDATETLGFMLSGKALSIQEDFWGNRNVMAFIGEGQSFGETSACVPGAVLTVSVFSQSPCTVMFLNLKRILTAYPTGCEYHSRMIQNLLSDLARKNLQLNEKLTHLGHRTTRAKLLSYLSAEAQRQGGFAFDIPFSRQQLADYLFVERSGLSLELSKMQEEGLLEFRRNHFVLKQNHVSM